MKTPKSPRPRSEPKVGIKPLAALNLDTANPWDHDDDNKRAILGSLKQWGPGRSIVLDGKDNVVAGNCTAEQAAQAGFTEVVYVEPEPHQLVAVRRPDWSPTEARGYSIADNKSASKASPNAQVLGEHFKALPENLWQATGFEKWEIEPLLAADWSPPAVKPMPEADGPAADHPHAVVFTEEQWGVIQRAIQMLRDAEEDQEIKDGRAIELMVADWLSRN